MSQLQPKLPGWNAPAARDLPSVPRVGCVGGQATTLINGQYGNAPDLAALPIIAALQKKLVEQIKALIDGQLPDRPRAIKYAAHAADLASFVSELIETANALKVNLSGEINAQISGINQKIAEARQAKTRILAVPSRARTKVQQLTLTRLGEYLAEYAAQIARLSEAASCIGSQSGKTSQQSEKEILEQAQTPMTDAAIVALSGEIIAESPAGAINGANAAFTTAYDFVPESVELFVNGLFQKMPTDFHTSGTKQILLSFSPAAGETILVNYKRGN